MFGKDFRKEVLIERWCNYYGFVMIVCELLGMGDWCYLKGDGDLFWLKCYGVVVLYWFVV